MVLSSSNFACLCGTTIGITVTTPLQLAVAEENLRSSATSSQLSGQKKEIQAMEYGVCKLCGLL